MHANFSAKWVNLLAAIEVLNEKKQLLLLQVTRATHRSDFQQSGIMSA
jgi:hypothetical protein